MATATAILTTNPHSPVSGPGGKDSTMQRFRLWGTCTLSVGGTYATGGIPIGNSSGQWALISPTTGVAEYPPNNSAVPATGSVSFFSMTGATGYLYTYNYTTGNLRIWNGSAELTNGAAITADTIGWAAEFCKGY